MTFEERVEERLDQIYEEYKKNKFTEVYWVTYVETGDGDLAEKKAEEESEEYAEWIVNNYRREIEAEIKEEMEED